MACDAVLDQNGPYVLFEEFVVGLGRAGVLGEVEFPKADEHQPNEDSDQGGSVELSRNDPRIRSKRYSYSIQRKNVPVPTQKPYFRPDLEAQNFVFIGFA